MFSYFSLLPVLFRSLRPAAYDNQGGCISSPSPEITPNYVYIGELYNLLLTLKSARHDS